MAELAGLISGSWHVGRRWRTTVKLRQYQLILTPLPLSIETLAAGWRNEVLRAEKLLLVLHWFLPPPTLTLAAGVTTAVHKSWPETLFSQLAVPSGGVTLCREAMDLQRSHTEHER